MNYCTYTKSPNGSFMIWNNETDEITHKPLRPYDIHHFELFAKKEILY
jgi:hypothetical protein